MIRVLVIDDSDVIRDALSSHLCASQDIEVVGTAVDAFIALCQAIVRGRDAVSSQTTEDDQ